MVDLCGAERISAVDQCDLPGDTAQEEGIGSGRIAPADNRNILAFIEHAIT